jgi:hypothetical protein
MRFPHQILELLLDVPSMEGLGRMRQALSLRR